MAATDVDDISQHIIANHKYFDELLSLVPARYYFAKEVEENKWNKYAKNKKDDKTTVKGKKSRKPAQDELDLSKTVPEILLERYRATADINDEAPAPAPKPSAAATTPIQPSPVTNNNPKKSKKPTSDESDDEEGGKSDSDDMQVDAAVAVDDGQMESFMANSSREEARKKLLEKINELRKKRKAVELDDKFKPRTDIEAPPSKRRKTAETDTTAAAGESGEQKKTNKQLKQENIDKTKKQQESKRQKQLQAAAAPADSDDDAEDSNAGQADDEPNPADIQFGTFDFSTGKPVPTYLAQKRKRPSNHVLLKKAEAEKKKMDELAGTAEGEAMREDKAWDAVMKRAAGEKVKDKPELLKKSIKRRETQKKKSAAKWKERTDMVQKQQEDKQKKRTENIKMALQRKRDKRMGIKPSDKRSGGGKNRPGFEGKKFSNK